MHQPPVISQNRVRLSKVLQATGKIVSIDDVVSALNLKRQDAAKILSRWAHQGWFTRVGPGLYALVPLNSYTNEQVLEDPWVLIPPLYGPCYVGGWTAAGYWDLTEQIFSEIFVFTTQSVRQKHQVHHGTKFVLKHTKENKLFGLKTVWRDGIKMFVSDKHRTIIDMIDSPETGGGIVHVAECFKNYLKDQESDINQLIDYSERLGNGAVFKRLGFLSEQVGIESLASLCRNRLTAGNSKLDPAIPSPRLIKRWNLWVPEVWQ